MVNLGPTTPREAVQHILNRAQQHRVGSAARRNLLLDAEVRALLIIADKPVTCSCPCRPEA